MRRAVLAVAVPGEVPDLLLDLIGQAGVFVPLTAAMRSRDPFNVELLDRPDDDLDITWPIREAFAEHFAPGTGTGGRYESVQMLEDALYAALIDVFGDALDLLPSGPDFGVDRLLALVEHLWVSIGLALAATGDWTELGLLAEVDPDLAHRPASSPAPPPRSDTPVRLAVGSLTIAPAAPPVAAAAAA